MIHRSTKIAFTLGLAMMVAGCHHNKIANPIANLDSKQPDKVLFDRAMDAMNHGKYDVARLSLQTLINTYPDSEFIARAKLGVGDSWYAEGSTASYQQAEVEYKDFITFFPNLPEAAEAQLKIANMHYKQMEKPDRDYTHAMRAEDEYRQLIQQWPDNTTLVPIAKQRLREVQEVLGERQYRIGRFYFLRESYPAAIARLKTLTDTYPLYSQADDALMMLGHSYDNEATLIKSSKVPEAVKARMVKEYEANAAQVYDRIIQRYPISDRADEARGRLKDMGQPVPTPTKEAIAQNKAEEESRSEMGHFGTVMANFHKAPNDLVRASKVGDPTLVDPQPTNAPEIIRAAASTAMGIGNGNSNVSAEKVTGDVTKNDPVPRSDAASAPPAPTSASDTGTSTATVVPATPPASASTTSDSGIGELTPTTAAPPAQPAAATSGTTNSTPSAATPDTPPQAPAQVNEVQSGNSAAPAGAASSSNTSNTSDEGSSSSKKKKKKGLKKLNPF